LDYVIRSAGSTAAAITFAVTASLLVWLYQCWRMLWMAVDLYKSPPMAQDFDLSKGFLTSQANPETAVSRRQTATP
jgi:hypothetical protein